MRNILTPSDIMLPFPNISPEIFSFNFLGMNFSLRWYAISYIVGFFCAIKLMKFFIKKKELWIKNKPPLNSIQADSLLTYLILGVILGGRLGYVLFYNFSYYVSNPLAVVKIWDGGMAFHGGFLGVCIAVLVYCLLNKVSLWSAADLIAVASPPACFLVELQISSMESFGDGLLSNPGELSFREHWPKHVKALLVLVPDTPLSSMKLF